MSTVNSWMNDDQDDDVQSVSYARRDVNRDSRMRRHAFERRRSRPRSNNGIHRRHNKRVAW